MKIKGNGSVLDPNQTPRQKLIRELQEARAAGMSTPPLVAAGAQEEQRRRQQLEEEERSKLAAEEAKNVRAVLDAQRLRRLEACRAVPLDHKLSPLSIEDQVALKEHAVKLKLPPEAYLNRCEQKLKNMITSKMQPEKLLKVTEEMLLYPLGPDTGPCWSRCTRRTA